MEKWKVIPDYSDYEISTYGNVRSLKNNAITPLSQATTIHGYKTVMLYNGKRKNITIHRLMAFTFIPNPENKATVNHIDGNKLNNSIENLEWATYKENQNHAFKNGLNEGGWKGKFGENHSKSKAVEFVDKNGNIIYSFGSARMAERETGHKNATISAQCIGKNKKHDTVDKWRFANVI